MTDTRKRRSWQMGLLLSSLGTREGFLAPKYSGGGASWITKRRTNWDKLVCCCFGTLAMGHVLIWVLRLDSRCCIFSSLCLDSCLMALRGASLTALPARVACVIRGCLAGSWCFGFYSKSCPGPGKLARCFVSVEMSNTLRPRFSGFST
jgi:hypothetical protein